MSVSNLSTSAMLTFVVATNDRGILERNLLASRIFAVEHSHRVLMQEGYSSAGAAYNDAIERSENDLLVFAHQDIYFPKNWIGDLAAAIEQLNTIDPNWGVLGCYGRTEKNEGRGYVYDSGMGLIGNSFSRPAPVQTLDEIVLILRKSSGLRFDQSIPHFHMYGADICLQAAERGMTSYAISALCIHNTYRSTGLPKEFYECYGHIKRKWKHAFPIYTPCIKVTRFNGPMHYMKLRAIYHRHVLRRTASEARWPNTETLLKKVGEALPDLGLESP